MNWDEPRPAPKAAIMLGEDLKTHGIAELEARIAALEAEITRTRAEISAKRAHTEAAAGLFKLG